MTPIVVDDGSGTGARDVIGTADDAHFRPHHRLRAAEAPLCTCNHFRNCNICNGYCCDSAGYDANHRFIGFGPQSDVNFDVTELHFRRRDPSKDTGNIFWLLALILYIYFIF